MPAARYEFCTLFDVNYLTRAIALYRSLEDVCGDFRLRAYCMDEASSALLPQLDLPRLTVVTLAELERHDQLLLSTKSDRTQIEYCWTATPAVCLHALETEPDIDQITYLDADLMFFADPAPLFDELGDEAVMIVPHRYAPEHRGMEQASGIYNVEWLTFRRDPDGLEALQWWHDRCIEWCYYRVEDGKMGDQKYLDDWPQRFPRVHVLDHPGGGLAPWNVTSYNIRRASDGSVLVDDRPLVFYHYHSLRLYFRTLPARLARLPGLVRTGIGEFPVFWQTNYPAPPGERELIWDPYLIRLGAAFGRVREVDRAFDAGIGVLPARPMVARLLRAVGRRVIMLVPGIGGRQRSAADEAVDR